MTQNLDVALQRLSSAPTHPGLAAIEDVVLERVHMKSSASHAQGLGIGALAAAGALLLGIAIGSPVEAPSSTGTLSPFGPSSPLAPSTLLAANR